MKFAPLITIILFASSLAVFAEAEEKAPREEIKFRSPDGRFALRLFGGDADRPPETTIIKLPSRATVLDLDDRGAPFIWQKKLVWSADSQRFAYFFPDRRGEMTQLFVRKGDLFEEVELPELPAPEFSKKRLEACEVVGHVDRPIRWLAGGLLLIYTEIEDECDNAAAAEVTVAFDKNAPFVLKTTNVAVGNKSRRR